MTAVWREARRCCVVQSLPVSAGLHRPRNLDAKQMEYDLNMAHVLNQLQFQEEARSRRLQQVGALARSSRVLTSIVTRRLCMEPWKPGES